MKKIFYVDYKQEGAGEFIAKFLGVKYKNGEVKYFTSLHEVNKEGLCDLLIEDHPFVNISYGVALNKFIKQNPLAIRLITRNSFSHNLIKDPKDKNVYYINRTKLDVNCLQKLLD